MEIIISVYAVRSALGGSTAVQDISCGICRRKNATFLGSWRGKTIGQNREIEKKQRLEGNSVIFTRNKGIL